LIRVGCAGWSLPKAAQGRFPGGESALARYARVFPVAEINSSFHRPHRAATYARWAASVPPGFRFSVKLAKTITHGAKLVDADALLDEFMVPVRALGESFGCLLVQLPPKLAFDVALARRFFASLRAHDIPAVALEPRHVSWFTAEADQLLDDAAVARVAADPPRGEGGAVPGGWAGFAYYRLHGTPRMYYSSYEDEFLDGLAARMAARQQSGWCIFDNTAGNAAVPNALDLMARLERQGHETQAAALRPRIPRGDRQPSRSGGRDGARARQVRGRSA
jgi:uncharacterized protein YecE (DUF72 family)